MTWPSSDVNTTGMDAGTDTPPRAEILNWAQKFNQLRAHVSTFMQGLLTSADAAAVRSALDVPTRTGGGASGIWSIGIHGNAATATSAGNADQLDGIDSTGFTRSTGISELGSAARTNASVNGNFGGGIILRNTGGGAWTGTFLDAELHNVPVAGVGFEDTGDGGAQVLMHCTPPGDPNTDRRVFGAFKLRNDGICEAKGFLPNGGAGAIGYPALLFSRSTNITIGSTYAGSSLRAQGLARASDSVCTTADNAGPAQTGTWLALTTQSAGPYGCLAFFIRIS